MRDFGLKITSPEEKKEVQERQKRFTMPESDGSTTVQTGGYYGIFVDMDGNIQNETQLILKYREMAMNQELDKAVNDIVNESIIFDERGKNVELNLDEVCEWNDNMKNKVRKEFEEILRMLDWKNKAYDIYRNWYVDGRLFYHCVIDHDTPTDGIVDLDYVDPLKIKKIRQINKQKDPKTGIEIVTKVDEFFLYNEAGIPRAQQNTGLRIAKDAVVYVPSGLLNAKRNQVISYLHKAIKPFNQLRMVEDAMVIYRLARAPERRMFYIDVGTMSTAKANQYIKSLQMNFRNKLVYDADTGEIRDDRKFMSMLEDFWLPRREGGKGTEISSLPGGQNLGDIADVDYFKNKLYETLNIPVSRLQPETGFSLGRTTEISRDEISFSKFIKKLRKQFSHFFDDVLEKQLVMKGIITTTEWKKVKDNIWYEFQNDIHFDQMKDAELLRDRIDMLTMIDIHVGKYFSKQWVMENVLQFSKEEIEIMVKQMEVEPDPMAEMDPTMQDADPFDAVRKARPPGGNGQAPAQKPAANGTGKVPISTDTIDTQ